MAHPSIQIEFKDFLDADEELRENITDASGRMGDIAGLHRIVKTKNNLFRSYIERIAYFCEKLCNALKGNSFQTANDIFQKAEAGKYARRTPDYSYTLQADSKQAYNIDITLV